jgi:hypothetical protein
MALLGAVTIALVFTAAAQAGFGIAKWEAGTCITDTPECEYTSPESQFYTQAAGHPPIGLTGFEVNTESAGLGKKPIGNVDNVRVDIPPGLSVNPQATCSEGQTEKECEGTGQCTLEQFQATACPSKSLVGTDEVFAYVGVINLERVSLPMYDLVPPPGVPAEFGFDLELGSVKTKVLIVGGLSWYKEPVTSEDAGVPTGNYHEYFTIKHAPYEGLELVKTRLKFTGTAGNGTFITLPSTCNTQISYLHISPYGDENNYQFAETLSGYPPKAISVKGCGQVPFAPQSSLAAGKSEEGPDRPDGVSTDVHVPQSESSSTLNSSDVQNGSVTLPEGLTMNPSAAHALKACTPQQIKIASNEAVECPAESEIGTVQIETSMLPPGALQGKVYLAAPSGTPITGPPYAIYVAAQSARYGVGVRLQGSVTPNPQTGQLTATFENTPPLPFEDFVLHLKGGEHAPLANPLVCEPQPSSIFTPYTAAFTGAPATSVPLLSPFSPGKGSVCASGAPFSLSQSTVDSSSIAGAHTSYTLDLTRPEGQQYLSKVSTTLPPGLVGPIPSVTLCGEPQAAAGQCSEASRIGTASVTAGSGDPYPFSGPVYLTGPYNGAPYGLSIVVPASAGPFELGNVVTRAQINVDPHTARLIVSSDLPTLYKGVPLRLRTLKVEVNRPNFLLNPTNCAVLSTDTSLTSTMSVTDSLSNPFAVSGCSSLPFKPKLTVSTSPRTSRLNGSSLTVKLTQGSGQANLREVHTELPKLLPARLSTLQKACRDEVFEANPDNCPAASKVGTATASTPVLPDKLSGPAYLVSHGGAAFPDLEIVLSGDGVSVILDGKTNIKNGITSSTFTTIPDVPVNSFELKLPAGRDSAITAIGETCAKRLIMPTAIVSQGSQTIKQNIKIAVKGCPPRILSKKIRGRTVTLVLAVAGAGTITAGGGQLTRVSRRLAKATHVTLKLGLSGHGLAALSRAGKLKTRLLIGFTEKGGAHSKIQTSVRFR